MLEAFSSCARSAAELPLLAEPSSARKHVSMVVCGLVHEDGRSAAFRALSRCAVQEHAAVDSATVVSKGGYAPA